MGCKCNFELWSVRLEVFYGNAKEKYEMPCSAAAEFLAQLDPAYHSDKYPLHQVRNYTISTSDHTYKSPLPETTAKAAAKIQLFMKDPNLMPKNS